MIQDARGQGTTRRSWLLACLAIPLSRVRAASNFSVTYDGDNLYPAAPDFHFLTPKVVARLRDSADTQAFISQLTIFSAQSDMPLRQAHARLVVSYSIWEETFASRHPGCSLAGGSHRGAGGVVVSRKPRRQRFGFGPVEAFPHSFRVTQRAPNRLQPGTRRSGDQHCQHDRYLQPQSRSGRRYLDSGDGLAAFDRSAAAFRPTRAPRVNRLRNRLILVFLAATLAPLARNPLGYHHAARI